MVMPLGYITQEDRTMQRKKMAKEFRSAPVGFSLARTTADNGCGVHQDKRTKRLRTRQQKTLAWRKEANFG